VVHEDGGGHDQRQRDDADRLGCGWLLPSTGASMGRRLWMGFPRVAAVRWWSDGRMMVMWGRRWRCIPRMVLRCEG